MYIYTTLGPFKDEISQGSISSGRVLEERVHEAGYDGIELSLSLLHHPDGRRLFEEIEFDNVTFHSDHNEFSLGSQNPYRRRAAVDQLRDETALSIENSVSILTFHPGYQGKKVSRDQAHANVIAALEEVMNTHAEALADGNTVLSLENMGASDDKLCRTVDELEQVLAALPQLGLTIDIAHCAYNQLDIDEFLDRLGSRVRHVHVSGYKNGHPHKKVSLPESELEMSPFIRRLKSDDMIFCIESSTLEVADETRAVLESVRDT